MINYMSILLRKTKITDNFGTIKSKKNLKIKKDIYNFCKHKIFQYRYLNLVPIKYIQFYKIK